MPSRSRSSNKVTKPAGGAAATHHGSRNSSLSSAAQEQLEQFAQQAASSASSSSNLSHANIAAHDDDVAELSAAVAGHSDASLDNAVNMSASSILSNGGSISSLHSSIHQVLGPGASFQIDQMPDQEHSTEPPRTAAEVAMAAYGDHLKIDSALCKKLAGEAALRDPTQRRHEQKLNIERRSNVEALLAHVTGELAAQPCKNCHKGHGPWTQCVVYDGQMCGSCSNCWFNASGSRCTFHEGNHPQAPQPYAHNPVAAPAVARGPGALPIVTYQQPVISQASPPNTNGAGPLLHSDISHWGVSDPTKHLVNHALGQVINYSRRDRFLARIEAAAKELGMRIAEYDEWCRSPEGMVEAEQFPVQNHVPVQQHPMQEDLEQKREHAQAPDTSMEEAHSGSEHLS